MEPFDRELASIPDPVSKLAAARFGIAHLTPWQRFAVANTLEGVDQLVVFPTGGGKSVCFLLPALLLPGVTVVVAPLLSLLRDQERRLLEAGIKCEVLRGGQSRAEREAAFDRLAARQSKIVFTVPEMLASTALPRSLGRIGVSHLAVDEAHCVSEWGKTFRPSYLKLGESARALGDPLISAYTATASPDIVRDIERLLFPGRAWTLVSQLPDRENIFYRVLPALSKNALLTRLVREAEKPMVVFTRSRSSAELSARLLRLRLGTEDVYFYHAGLEKSERNRVEEWFFPSKTGVLCATSAYGMGIDKPDIRTVIHRECPPSIEAYLQESGRAGRDGELSQAVLMQGRDDRLFLEVLSEREAGASVDAGASREARARYKRVYDYAAVSASAGGCRRRYLLNALGAEEETVCSGCDACAGEIVLRPEGFTEITRVVRGAPRRYTKRELCALLNGAVGDEARRQNLAQRRGYGVLRPWEREDIEEAVEALEADRLIRAPARGFFKHRYQLVKRVGMGK